MSDKRDAPRKRILKAGKIEFGWGATDCVVRNISETGASLEVESPVGIPDRFDLVISIDRSRRAASVVWRKEKRIWRAVWCGSRLMQKAVWAFRGRQPQDPAQHQTGIDRQYRGAYRLPGATRK